MVIPARVATPTDKPKAEVSVQIVERWILGFPARRGLRSPLARDFLENVNAHDLPDLDGTWRRRTRDRQGCGAARR